MTFPGRIRTAILVLAILAAGTIVRVAVPGQDLFGPQPLPFPDDPPYHVLRVERLAGLHDSGENPGGDDQGNYVSSIDPMIAHPFGDRCIWPWGYDWLAAAVIPGGGSCDHACVLRIAGMIPVAVSLVTALLVFLIAGRLRRWRDPGTDPDGTGSLLVPAAAAAFFLLMPGNVAYSMAGRFDHHVMEPLFIALPMLLVSARGRGRLPGIAAGGLLLGLGAAFFPAAPAISFPVFVVAGAFLSGPAGAAAWSAGMLGGLALSLPASPTPFEWVHYSPSVWHIATAACLSGGLVGFHAVRTIVTRRRLSSLFGLGLAAVAGTIAVAAAAGLMHMLFPAWIPAIVDGFRYVSSSGFADLSLEASSFKDDPVRMMELTGWLLVPGIVGLCALALPSPAGRRHPMTAAFISIFVVLVCLAAAQRRFLVAATPMIAVFAAFGMDFIAAAASSGHFRRAGRRRVLLAGLGAFAMITASVSSIADLKYLTPSDRAMYAAAEAISQSPGDGRGTMAPWGYGHLFKYAAGAPTVCDNFFGVPGADAAMRRCLSLLYATDDQTIEDSLQTLGIRFVVFAPPHPEQIRIETAILGLKPTDWVDADNRISQLFTQTFFGRTGMWASTAEVGATGPWNMTLRGRFRQVDPSTRQVEAEVLLLEHVPAKPR